MDNHEPKESKRGLHKEIDILLEKLSAAHRDRLKDVDALRKNVTRKLDREIKNLYAKKNRIVDILIKKSDLKEQKISLFRQFVRIIRTKPTLFARYIISVPFIYSILVPAIFLHIVLEMYHQICFRLYSIPLVSPREYFTFDRRHLPYLNWFEKLNCLYCSYFNCLIAYAKEIAGRTERYWCPIKHANMLKDRHEHYKHFVGYESGTELRKKWQSIRSFDELKK